MLALQEGPGEGSGSVCAMSAAQVRKGGPQCQRQSGLKENYSEPSDLKLGLCVLGFRALGLWIFHFGFWVPGSFLQAKGLQTFWVLGFGFWILCFGFGILGFGFCVLSFGFRCRPGCSGGMLGWGALMEFRLLCRRPKTCRV